MIVGYMRLANKPTPLANLTAMLCHSQGLNLLFMRPYDVDIVSNTVKGLLYDGIKWVEVNAEIPLVIDANQPCFKKKYQPIIKYLRSYSNLTYDSKGSFNKQLLLRKLEDDSEFSHLVIPTIAADNFNEILEFLNKHQAIVLKPIHSDRGRGVYKLIKEEDTYILSFLTKTRKFQRDELEKYFDEFIKIKNYISQKYIASSTKQGDPFDCRVHVQKNGRGRWVVARNYVRVGIGQKVISNVNQGGGISELLPFLKANFEEQWEEIYNKIILLGRTLPYKIEKLKGTPSMSIGFDVAIDKTGELYLLESNGNPSIKPVFAKTSLLRVQYYKYMFNKIVNQKRLKKVNKKHSHLLKEKVDLDKYKKALNRIENLKNEIESSEQERDFYKNEYLKMMKSTSWKLSAPIRKIGSLKKMLKLKLK